MARTVLPKSLHDTHRWIEAGGDLDRLRDMSDSDASVYAASVAFDFHSKMEDGDIPDWEGSEIFISDVLQLRSWLRSERHAG